jgi:hypothetical protein
MRDVWNDRPVTFADFTVREGEVLGPAFEVSAQEGSYMLLALSLRYTDTNELVFKDGEDVWSQPFRLRPALARLSAKAAFYHGLVSTDPDAPVVTNGSGTAPEAPGPSH